MTPQYRDELRLTYAPILLAAIQPTAADLRDMADAEALARESPEALAALRATQNDDRMRRALHAASEADALIAELETRLEVQTFPDGQPIDPRALDPSKQFCAHGVSMADDCAACAANEPAAPWKRDNAVTADVLSLVCDHEVPPEVIETWTDDQVREAEMWAGAVHLRASDNDDVPIPPTPAHVAAYCA